MKKICLVLALVALFAVSAVQAVEEEEDVLVLTDSNFNDELAKHDYLLVEFYAPWCGHCKSLAPEYAKAAKKLKENNPPYYIAKVDATENKALGERFEVRGFPTLIFFKKGQKMEYNGGRTENEIVNWILKKVGPPSTQATCDELKKKVEDNKLVVAFFGDASSREFTEVYQEVAQNPSVSEKFQFFHLDDKECAASYGASSTPALVLFRKFDDSPLVFSGNWETTPVVDWMVGSSVPTLIEFSEDYIEPIFGQRKSAVFLFRGNDDAQKPFSKIFSEAAHLLKGSVLFVTSGVKDGIQQRLAEFIGVEESQLPTMTLLNPSDNMKKFQFPGKIADLSLDSLKSWIEDFKSGKLQPFLKSQEIPEQNEPTKIIVGKNFKDIVLDDNTDVLIEFYAPWCGHCKKLAPIWDQVATDLKDVPNLVIAKFDATANEVDGLEIKGYPTLKFYPKGQKSNPIDFDGERGAEDIKNWLKEKSVAYKQYLENKSEL